jgi:4-hydroxybenzoate polyprenyltransferase
MYRFLNHIADFTRWRDWGPSKIPVFCVGLLYAGLANRQISTAFVLDFFMFIVFITFQSSLGYVVNNWGDRELDGLHNKPNPFAHLTHAQGIMALGALLVFALLSGLPFVGRPMVLPLWMSLFFLSLAYSLKPLRLKERGVLGLAAATVAQWPLPIMLTFAVLNRFGGWDMIVFVLAITISGVTLEISHQRFDRARDLITQTGTLGSRMGITKLDLSLSIALLLDKIALGSILVTIAVGLAPVTIETYSLSPGLPLLGIYAILFAAALYETSQSMKRGELLDPYYSPQPSASKLLHETLPNFVVPTYLVVLATVYQPINGLLLLTFLYWRLVLGQADWRWPLQFAMNWWKKKQREIPQ